MPFSYEIINCQIPKNKANVERIYKVVKCIFNNKIDGSVAYYNKAWNLARQVNPNRANDSISSREKDLIVLDSIGGILAEYGWFYYIKRNFGDIVSFTEFKSSINQIDLLLKNGKTIEVRSSFPKNGVKFAICNERYNFKNICKYENLYKPSEADKDFFASVLFQTKKNEIKNAKKIEFYLIGGSTKEMMLNNDISFISNLIAEDDLIQEKTKYKVIKLCNILDIDGFEKYMDNMGFVKLQNKNTF